MAKPTVVCVPGAWHSPEVYSRVFSILEGHGYPTVGLPLPSVGTSLADDYEQDVKAIQDCLTRLADAEEKEVVLVLHSYSGLPGTEAPVGLGKKEREAKGLKGGVIRIVYIMAFAMPEGFEPTGKQPLPEFMKLDHEKGIVSVGSEDAKRLFYNDLPSREADEWVAKLTHSSIGVFTNIRPTKYAAWKHIPSTFVIGTQDNSAFTPQIAEFIIGTAKTMEPSAFDVVEKCDASHSLMVSRPEWLADVLRRAAGEAC